MQAPFAGSTALAAMHPSPPWHGGLVLRAEQHIRPTPPLEPLNRRLLRTPIAPISTRASLSIPATPTDTWQEPMPLPDTPAQPASTGRYPIVVVPGFITSHLQRAEGPGCLTNFFEKWFDR